MSHQQNQANNLDGNGNIQLHLNANISRMAYATIASSSPVRTQSPAEMPRILQQQPKPQLQLGDIYEFHSSPEEDNFSAAPGSGFLPLTNPTAICSQQKSSSASSIPNILATASTSCPPPKRIKTAVLAKKLLAAAAVIDPTKLPKSEDRKNVPAETMDGEKELNKNDGETANLTEESEKDGGDMMEEMEGTTIEEDLQQKQRANSISSTASQEQKKVPPLRISLLKTPSEENGEQPKQSSTASTSSPCGVASNVSRKTRGGAIRISSGGGLRKVGGGHGHGHHESKKDNLQRVTRSKVKQINSSNEAGDIHQYGHHGRKRRNRGIGAERGGGNINEMEEEMANNSSSTLSMRTFAPFEEEEDNNSATMMNNAQMDDEGIMAAENGTIIRRNNSILGEEQHRNGNEELQQLNSEMGNSGTVEMEKPPAKPSAASIMLNKNSLEQSFGFESMMREKWTKQYKAHLAHVIDKVNMATKLDDEHRPPNNGSCQFSSSKSEPKLINNEWPEPLRKLYTEQEKRRQELAEEHRLDRERIQSMVQREIVRFEETNSQQNGSGGGLFSIVSYLRDIECYDPTLLAESMNKISPIHQPTNRFQSQTLQQIQQRFAYLANTTKNRHTLEAQSLAGNQKAEWQRIARRIQRENEQQQLMMKGPIGSGAVGKQQKSTISFPADFWAESAVTQIAIPEIQFPSQFKKCS